MKLRIENLCKSYKNKVVLNDINLTLQEGVYGLLGENGAGKSTLMRILTTVDFQSSGRVMFNEHDIMYLNENYRDILGYMPQDYSIFPSFTARDFLRYIGTLKGINKNVLEERIEDVLEFVNLSDVGNKKVKNFSGGMKRRIGIAQAIINNPKILILDEPTAGLDPKERIRFANIISSMSKDKIIILSTHIVSDIEAIANNVIVIKNGKILKSEKIEKLTQSINGSVWESVIEQDVFNKLSQERQIIYRKQDGNQIKVRYAGIKFGEISSKEVEPNLEDYYMYVCI